MTLRDELQGVLEEVAFHAEDYYRGKRRDPLPFPNYVARLEKIFDDHPGVHLDEDEVETALFAAGETISIEASTLGREMETRLVKLTKKLEGQG